MPSRERILAAAAQEHGRQHGSISRQARAPSQSRKDGGRYLERLVKRFESLLPADKIRRVWQRGTCACRSVREHGTQPWEG